MHKVMLSLACVSAISLSAGANAAITITGSTEVDAAITVVNGATQSTVGWGRNPEPTGSFTGAVDFFNNLSGLYSIIVSTSTPFASITSLSVSGIGVPVGGTPPAGIGAFSSIGSSNSLSLLVPSLAAGNYRVSFGGAAPANGAVATGNLTFQLQAVPETQVQAVPEAGTWAMMLVGFGGIGFAMRRGRRGAGALMRIA